MKTKLKTRTLLALLLIPGFAFIHLSVHNRELLILALPMLAIGGYNLGVVLRMLQEN